MLLLVKSAMVNEDMKSTEKAFNWIVGILRSHKILFQITGGMAARVYGSHRALADIDIDIPEEKFDEILADMKEYIVFGPKQFIDANWDLLLMTLNYEGQEIDICSDRAKMRDTRIGEWHESQTDFLQSENHEIFGILVPVINKDELIEYKKM